MLDRPAASRSQAPRPDPLQFVPAVCDVSVTNACNADCGFCGFARSKQEIPLRDFIDADIFAEAVPILKRRGVSFINFQGGEPLQHPRILDLIRAARAAQMKPALITNGWLLPRRIEKLVDAGLGTLLVSIDAADAATHERNRGLNGVWERIRTGLETARRHGLPRLASVTVSRLVDFDALPDALRDLGFSAVTFSYPRVEPFGSSSLVFGGASDLVSFTPEELLAAFDAIDAMRSRFPVMNPAASVADMRRHVRGEPEVFACVGGHKYFYMDWNLQIWRCEAWSEPMGSVLDLDDYPDRRDRCTSCMMSCYRDTSVLMRAGIAAEDALSHLANGRMRAGLGAMFDRSVALSLGAVAREARQVIRLARPGNTGKIAAQERA